MPDTLSANSRSQGFTLIELVIVVVILGVLTAVAVPSYLSHRRGAFDARSVADTRQMAAIQTGATMGAGARAEALPHSQSRVGSVGHLRWRTGDDPGLKEGFAQSEGVTTHVYTDPDSPDQWCVLSWHPRGNLNSPAHSAWSASDSTGVHRTQPPATSDVCSMLADLTPADPAPEPETDPPPTTPVNPPAPVELNPDPNDNTPHLTLVFDMAFDDDNTVAIRLDDLQGNVTIDWGNGVREPAVAGNNTHTFETNGRYTVRVEGRFRTLGGQPAMQGANQGLVGVVSWRSTGTTNAAHAFEHAPWLMASVPPFREITVYDYMFRGATTFNGSVAGWDTGLARSMAGLFQDAEAFNQRITWNISNVNNVEGMFSGATSFNNGMPAGVASPDATLRWRSLRSPSVARLFENASAFNQVVELELNQLRNFERMFAGAASFNQNFDRQPGTVVSMDGMFDGASAFDQDLSNWRVSSIPSTPPRFAYGTPDGFTVARQPRWG